MSRKSATAEKAPELFKEQPQGQPPAKPDKKPPKGALVAANTQRAALPAKSMLQIVAEAAANPNVDVAKMQALLDMQEKLEREESRKAFIRDFIALSEDMPSISQDGKIKVLKKGADGQRVEGRDKVQQETPYATFNNIARTIKPLLRKYGFALSFSTEPTTNGDRIIVKGLLEHNMGYSRTTSFPLPAETSGSKNNVQGWGSSMSYGKRYATIALLNIVSHAAEDADRDGHAPDKGKRATKAIQDDVVDGDAVELCNDAQRKAVREAIKFCGVSDKTFCQHFGVDKVENLPAAEFDNALLACRQYAEKHGKTENADG